MPVYDFSCTCGKEWEQYLVAFDSPNPTCECGKPTERVWALGTNHNPGGTYPYITKNILPNGQPVEVTSAAHLDRLCRENGVTHRPDNGWLGKEYKGVDFRTGKQIYKEGSGMGLPGTWI